MESTFLNLASGIAIIFYARLQNKFPAAGGIFNGSCLPHCLIRKPHVKESMQPETDVFRNRVWLRDRPQD